MAKENDLKKGTRRFLNEIFLWIMLSGFLISIILLLISFNVKDADYKNIILIFFSIIIGAVIVSFIQVKILGKFYNEESRSAIFPDLKNLEAKITKEIEDLYRDIQSKLSVLPQDIKNSTLESVNNIVPEIKQSTLSSINDIKEKINEATNFMLNGIGVLSGAKKTGIINIFPNRYDKITGESLVETIKFELLNERNSIKLMGISLGDYFLDRGVLHKTFTELLSKPLDTISCKMNIQALIINPKSQTLKERARWEAGEEYKDEPAFFDSTTFIETDGAARIAKRLCQKNNALEVRLYNVAPTTFILMTSRFAFIESYNYSDRGSNVPTFQIEANCDLYKRYENHFNRIWEVSLPLKSYDSFNQ